MMKIEKLVLHVSDAACLLGISSQKVYEMIHAGKLLAYKDGKAWKINTSSIEDYIRLKLSK